MSTIEHYIRPKAWSPDHSNENVFNIRIWEILVASSVMTTFGYWYYACRTKFMLGIYLGFTLCFGWTWLFDQPFFLAVEFHPASIHGFTYGGHEEALWTGFSFCAIGLPVMHYLNNRQALRKTLGRLGSYLLYAYGGGFFIMLYEGCVAVKLLGAEHYHWRPENLLFGIPYTTPWVFVPLLITIPIFFAENAESVLRTAGDIPIPKTAAGVPPSATPLMSGTWHSFWLGMAAVQSAMFFIALFMIPYLDWLQPWTTDHLEKSNPLA